MKKEFRTNNNRNNKYDNENKVFINISLFILDKPIRNQKHLQITIDEVFSFNQIY